MATTRPSSWRRRTSSALCSGSTSARPRSMPTWRAIAVAVRALSPVIIATWIPSPRRAARVGESVNLGIQVGGVDRGLVEESTVANEDLVAVDERSDAFAGNRLEVGRRRQLESSVADAGDDRLGEGVLGRLFGRGDEAQHRVRVDAFTDDDVGECWFPAGDGAGLVQHDGVDLVRGSRDSAERMRMPCSAPLPVETMIAVTGAFRD
ncbi:MAG: hypothetical protein ABMA25_03070 [Ilumatobacteraceae bacterium]